MIEGTSRAVPVSRHALLLRRYDSMLEWIDRVVSVVVTLAMAVLTTVICAQVFYRYVLNSSIDWSWDVPRLCFIWMGLLAIPLGLKRHAHVGIDIVLARLPREHQQLVLRINLILMGVMMALVAAYAVQLARTTWPQLLTTIDVSVGVLYIGLFICSVHSILHIIRQLVVPPPVGILEAEIE
jgi:TRAP-type C4-dicarboxylate transport system permease small subunit